MRIRCRFPRGYGEYRINLSLTPLERLTLELALPVELLFSGITTENTPELAESLVFLCQWLEPLEEDSDIFKRKREIIISLLWEDCDELTKVILAGWPTRYLK